MSLNLPGKMKVNFQSVHVCFDNFLISLISPARCFGGGDQSSAEQQRTGRRNDSGGQQATTNCQTTTPTRTTAATAYETTQR